jgi:cytochrome c oxidase assembly factor CtaG
MPELLAAAGLAAVGATYFAGIRVVWARAGHGRVVNPLRAAAFTAGLAAVLVAVTGPLDDGAATSLSAHMAQHLLLLAVAPPLLAAGGFGLATMALLTPARRKAIARLVAHVAPGSNTRAWLAWLAAATVAQAAALVAWHLPPAYDAAVAHPPLHALEHASFLVTGLVFWWAALGAGRRSRRGWGFVAVFLATFPATALGVAMTLASTAWYAPYAHGAPRAALEDQQVAGAVMWGFGSLAAVVTAAALFASWLNALEHASPHGLEPS